MIDEFSGSVSPGRAREQDHIALRRRIEKQSGQSVTVIIDGQEVSATINYVSSDGVHLKLGDGGTRLVPLLEVETCIQGLGLPPRRAPQLR